MVASIETQMSLGRHFRYLGWGRRGGACWRSITEEAGIGNQTKRTGKGLGFQNHWNQVLVYCWDFSVLYGFLLTLSLQVSCTGQRTHGSWIWHFVLSAPKKGLSCLWFSCENPMEGFQLDWLRSLVASPWMEHLWKRWQLPPVGVGGKAVLKRREGVWTGRIRQVSVLVELGCLY